MNKITGFLKTSLLGGVVVILPVAILISVSVWFFNLVNKVIQPLTSWLTGKTYFNEYLAAAIVIIFILAACFFVGVLVKTRLGGYFYRIIESRLLKLAPGYTMIKETVLQIFGSEKGSPFSSVALVQVYGNETLMTAFITDTHEDGSYTLFVPTGPNPTSGLIFHLKGKYVHPVDVPVQDAMRSIISCGAGSSKLIQKFLSRTGTPSISP